MKLLIGLLTAATGILHLLVGFDIVAGFGTTNWILVLNGIGYLVLLVLFWTAAGSRRGTIRWILLAYTLLTLVGYFILNGSGAFDNTMGLVIKAIELLLIILLFLDRGSDRERVPAAAPAASRAGTGAAAGTVAGVGAYNQRASTTVDTTIDTTAATAASAYDTAASGAAAVAGLGAGAAYSAADMGEAVAEEAEENADEVGEAAEESLSDWDDRSAGAIAAAGDMAGGAVDATGAALLGTAAVIGAAGADAAEEVDESLEMGDVGAAAGDMAGDAVDATDAALLGAAAVMAGDSGVEETRGFGDVDAGAAAVAAEPTSEDLRAELEEYLRSFGSSSEFRKEIEYVEGIGAVYGGKLRAAGVVTVLDLMVEGATRLGRKHLSDRSGITQSQILTWVNHIDLYRLKGVAQEYADLLEQSGVDTVVELAQRNPNNLFKRMNEINEQKKLVRRTPHLSEVQSWVEQAKNLKRLIHY